MKAIKIIILIISITLFNVFLFSQTGITTDYKSINQSFFPRDEGSDNEKKLIDNIESFCELNEIEYKTTKIENHRDIITNSYNIEIYFKGSGKENEKIIIACPYNSPIINQKDYDNSISIQIMFNLIKLCKEVELKKDIIFLFSGANQSENSNLSGLKYFIENSVNLNKTFVTIIDILSNKKKIRFTGSINNRVISQEILKKFLKINKEGLKLYFNSDEIYRARFKIKKDNEFLSLFLNENINTVLFSNKENTRTNYFFYDNEYQKKLTNFFYNWILSISNVSIPTENDTHYLYFNFLNFNIIIPEYLQILSFLIILLLMITLRILFPTFQKFHFNLLFRSVPFFLIILLAYYVLSFLPLSMFLPLGFILGIDFSYIYSSILYFINIFIIPLLILYIIFGYLGKVSFFKHSYLYIFGAFVFSLLNFLFFIIVDISVANIFLFSIICMLLSTFTGNYLKIKYLLYFISPVPLILLLISLTFNENIVLTSNTNPVIINLFFSVLTFPFILLFLRILIIQLNRFKVVYIKKRNFFIGIFVLISFSILILFVISIYKLQERKIILAQVKTDLTKNTSQLTLESKINIGKILIQDNLNTKYYNINKKNKTLFLKNTADYPFIIKKEIKRNGEINLNINITSKTNMEYIRIHIITLPDIPPLNSNLSFLKTEKTDKEFDPEKEEIYSFNIPRNPGNSFLCDMTLIEGNYKIFIEIEYPFIEESIVKIKKRNCIILNKSIFSDVINIP